MTATNHALTGAAIGLLIGQPVVAIPAALASHFICDIIPHYRADVTEKRLLKSNKFRNYLLLEAAVCLLIVIGLAVLHPLNWRLAAICAFVAASPDLLYINRYRQVRRGHSWRPGRFVAFASRIQWFERPIGGAVEVAWFIAAIAVLTPFLLR